MKPATVSLKTTVKAIGLTLVGSTWPTAWLTVTVGAIRSTVAVRLTSDAGPAFPARSAAPLARKLRTTLPFEQPVRVTDRVAPEPVGLPMTQPVAVEPVVVRSAAVTPVTDSLNVRVYTRLAALVMLSALDTPLSDAALRSIVTVGATLSQVTLLSVEVDAALALPAVSIATPAAIVATTVPDVVIPVTDTE